jgi:hypothetical protein
MRLRLLALALVAAGGLLPGQAAAQLDVQATIRLTLPPLPRLVVIQPGLQVVEDQDDEVFLHQGTYSARRGDRWYRARDRHGDFLVVETRMVPEPLRKLPPGHYRRYRAPPPAPPPHESKKDEKARHKAEDKAREQQEHDQGRDHDHQEGKGR